LAKAYLRKGTACMKLEEYSTAKAALEKGASVAPNEPKFKKMIDECDLRIAVFVSLFRRRERFGSADATEFAFKLYNTTSNGS